LWILWQIREASPKVQMAEASACDELYALGRDEEARGDVAAAADLYARAARGSGTTVALRLARKRLPETVRLVPGSLDAALALARLHHVGRRGERDDGGLRRSQKAAVRYLELAAARGSTDAMDALGYCHFEGHGVPRDGDAAEALWARSRAAQEALWDPAAAARAARARAAKRPRPSPPAEAAAEPAKEPAAEPAAPEEAVEEAAAAPEEAVEEAAAAPEDAVEEAAAAPEAAVEEAAAAEEAAPPGEPAPSAEARPPAAGPAPDAAAPADVAAPDAGPAPEPGDMFQPSETRRRAPSVTRLRAHSIDELIGGLTRRPSDAKDEDAPPPAEAPAPARAPVVDPASWRPEWMLEPGAAAEADAAPAEAAGDPMVGVEPAASPAPAVAEAAAAQAQALFEEMQDAGP